MSKAQDTNFIDMKYIILYRKLGFKEIKPDIYIKKYDKDKIIIESENQFFIFLGSKYNLLIYRDMVVLELLDRLLTLGYKGEDLSVKDNEVIIKRDGYRFKTIKCFDWGLDYERTNEQESFNEDLVFYCSRLTGGLIEYQYGGIKDNSMYDYGLFENGLYPENLSKKYSGDVHEKSGFLIKDGTLLKYLGSSEFVKIPPHITCIGVGAFWNNLNIREVVIPESVETIKGDAFVYCENLEKVNIPCNVTKIGDNPFAGCPKLELIVNSPYFTFEDNVLYNLKKTELIHYSISKEESEFSIPNTVEWVGKHSFYKCNNLEKVVISENVSFMGNNVFSDCEKIVLHNLSPYFHYEKGVLYNAKKTQVYHFSMGSMETDIELHCNTRTIGRNSFWNAKHIKSIVIPINVRQIGYNPFANCENLKFINKSPYYRTYKDLLYSFDYSELVCCTNIMTRKDIELHNKLQRIGRNAFVGCTDLTEIILPQDLTEISRGAFSGCSSLQEITIPNNVEFIGDWAFNECTSLEKVYVYKEYSFAPNTFNSCTAKVVKIDG
ncbi:MAG: leucine-rich repeat domain-containing protein [Acholeplasmataceae bacterium]|nr:leucine-rich repeat domain-containing protein [Acholeplasmataceae bacterium]